MLLSSNTRILSRGFTLIEVMVVVVILGILASLVVPQLIHRPDDAKRIKVFHDLRALEDALALYHLDQGMYPSTVQGLDALIHPPQVEPLPPHWQRYLKKLPKDPWGHPYHYRYPSEHEAQAFDLYTLGAHNQPGGTGLDADIGNWNVP